MDMGGWLGFSLSPHNHHHHHPNHHHTHHPQHQQNHQNHFTSGVSENNRPGTPSCFSNDGFESAGHVSGAGFGFPLGVNEPFCIMEPFRSSNDWRFSSPMNSNSGSNNNNDEENKCPKLENFLGGGYTENSSSENNSFQHGISPFNEIYYQSLNLGSNSSNNDNNNCSHHDDINVNMPLTFPNSPLHREAEEDIRYPFRYLIQTTQHSSSLEETDHLKSHYNLLPATNFLHIPDNNPQHNNHTANVYGASVGFDAGSSSISGFKSWLRQNAYAAVGGEKQMVEEGEGEGEGDGNKPSIYNSLSLSMNPIPINIQPPPLLSNEIFCPAQTPPTLSLEDRKRPTGKSINRDSIPRKSIESFGQRTSQYRGVTRHRWTGRYEAHLWDNSCRKEGQTRKGRQVYLGGYDREEKAARAYDLAALKYWGPATHINFALGVYEKEMEEMKNMTRQEFVASLRRKSSGFSRGASIYRGVTRHHQHGRWQARIGRVAGNKDLYLGTFGTQEKAAEAYDIAAIKFRGLSAVTNFDISRYDVERICSSDTLISADLARRPPKTDAVASVEDSNGQEHQVGSSDLLNKTSKSHHNLVSTIMEKPADTAATSLPLMVDQYGDYSHAVFSILEPKGDNNGDASTPMRTSGFPPLHQFPAMFALWNE